MKFFKKLFLLLICATVVLGAGCTSTKTYKLFGGSFWLENSAESGVAAVYEKCTYTVEVVDAKTENLSLQIENAEFHTILSAPEAAPEKVADLYPNTPCYKFITVLSLTGYYQHGEEQIAVNDVQLSECYFLGLNDKLSPIYSQKYVYSTTPVSSENGVIFPVIEYTAETIYNRSEKVANLSVVAGENNDKENGLEFISKNGKETANSISKEFEDYNKNAFIDNSCMFFLPRACALEEGFSQTFYTLDYLAQKIQPMNIAVNYSTPTSKIVLDGFRIDGGKKENEFNAFNVLIKINDKFSGKALEFCYAGTKDKNLLIQFKQPLIGDLGNLKFTLHDVKTKKPTE